MKKLFFLVLLLSNCIGQAQYTLIPDVNFEKVLIDKGIDTGTPNGKVLTTNINGVKILNLANGGILDLTGIQGFLALTDLDCSYNPLASLDISKNTALTSLDCVGNQLSSLDVTKNAALTSLDCGGNQLSSLDVTKNAALTYLYCSSNQLTNLDVTKNLVLKDLKCYYNPLTSLDVTKNISLTVLWCLSNQLTSLDVTKNLILTELKCYENQLTSLDVTNNTSLNYLDCYGNQLTSLDITKNLVLTDLNCGSNQLTSLDVTKNTFLTYLGCYANQLTSLNVTKNTTLIYLFCFSNQLTSLNVTKNTTLTVLECYTNQLTSLDVTKNLVLKDLNCFYNKLTSLNVTENTALTDLACGANQLTSLDVTKNTALTDLACSANQLTSLNLKNGNNINLDSVYLDLTGNPNLKCIQVDNKAYSDANWSTKKDAIASFSENCNKIAATPPKITASGNQIYCVKSSLNIIPTPAPTENITITYDPSEPATEEMYVQISSGYVSGSDLLSLANPTFHQSKNIFPNWNVATGKLKLYSPTGTKILYTNFEAALKDVIFSNSETTPFGTRTFSITIGQANYLPSTQHFYEYVPSLGISWTDAKLAAEGRNYYGLKGYLATVMAADEAQLTGIQSSGAGWLGGTDSASEGTWRWVTGPEGLANGGQGIVFWNGQVSGTTPNFAFWNKLNGEPNQFGNREEDYVHITDPKVGNPGSWNDVILNGYPTGFSQPKGYIVEYGGMPGDPILQIAASTSITIPTKVDFEPELRCFTGSLTLKPKNFTGNIIWYTAGGTLLTIANTYSPSISSTTSYFTDPSNGVCPLNPRIEVVATVISPSVTPSSIPPTPICGNGKTTLNATASSASVINWYNSLTSTTSLATGTSYTTPDITTDTPFYVDATELGCVTTPRTPIKAVVSSVPSITSTTPATRCDTGTVTLEAVSSSGTLNWYDSDKGGTLVGTGNTITTPSISITTPFYVDATEASCTSLRTEVVANIFPIDKNNQEVVLCQTKTATLNASIPGLNYLWSPGGETTQSIDVTTIGDYTVSISSPISTSCGSKKIFNVIKRPKPEINTIEIDENSITIVLKNAADYYEFSIDGVIFQPSNEFSFIPSGLQTAYVREKSDCNLVTQDFTVFSIAKFFTPNNDGINDTWLIPEMKDYLGSNVKIFDRYGKLLKQMNAGIIGWNGKFNTLDLPADDYWYVLKLDPTQPEIRGHFTLKR